MLKHWRYYELIFLWCVAEEVGPMVFVCLSVCPSILARGAPTAGQIGTGDTPFDAPERRKDDGNNDSVAGTTW